MPKLFFTLLVLLTFGSLTGAHAQAPGSTGPAPGAPAAVPLDGGASLLLASGVAYGVRHLRQRRKRAQ
jgi:hypothetical protein